MFFFFLDSSLDTCMIAIPSIRSAFQVRPAPSALSCFTAPIRSSRTPSLRFHVYLTLYNLMCGLPMDHSFPREDRSAFWTPQIAASIVFLDPLLITFHQKPTPRLVIFVQETVTSRAVYCYCLHVRHRGSFFLSPVLSIATCTMETLKHHTSLCAGQYRFDIRTYYHEISVPGDNFDALEKSHKWYQARIHVLLERDDIFIACMVECRP